MTTSLMHLECCSSFTNELYHVVILAGALLEKADFNTFGLY
jgi:hypothetical protein